MVPSRVIAALNDPGYHSLQTGRLIESHVEGCRRAIRSDDLERLKPVKYLGTARKEQGQIRMPDGFGDVSEGQTFEAIEVGGDIFLLRSPLDRQRMDHIAELTTRSIEEHRTSLESLAR